MSPITENLLLKNSTSFAERREIQSIVGEASLALDNILVDKLYTSALNKSHIDFGDIPKSKGDITKYSGYKHMLEVLDVVDDLAKASDLTIQETSIVRRAIDNIKGLKAQFTLGYKLEKKFVQMSYETLVLGCVDATSGIISSYVSFITDAAETEVVVKPSKDKPYKLAINNLDKFNQSVLKGDFSKALDAINTTKGNVKESFEDVEEAGFEDAVNGAKGIASALGGTWSKLPNGAKTSVKVIIAMAAIVTVIYIIRELIFYFFYSSSKISDYLEQQANLLLINKEVVKANNKFSDKKKKKIITKQEKVAKTLMKISEKLKIKSKLGTEKAEKELAKENKGYSLKDLRNTSIDDDNSFELIM